MFAVIMTGVVPVDILYYTQDKLLIDFEILCRVHHEISHSFSPTEAYIKNLISSAFFFFPEFKKLFL